MIKHLSYFKSYRRYLPKFLMNCTGCSCIAIQECRNVNMEYGNAKKFNSPISFKLNQFHVSKGIRNAIKTMKRSMTNPLECLFVKRSFKN